MSRECLPSTLAVRRLPAKPACSHGIALCSSPPSRRKGIAALLLQSVELVAQAWGFEHLALHVHEDNMGARKLYAQAGYQPLSRDPDWMVRLLGTRRRILLAKRTDSFFPQVDRQALLRMVKDGQEEWQGA